MSDKVVGTLAKVGGVDDAGRGSILGPLIIAGVSMSNRGLKELTRVSVKDSKLLSPTSRSSLYTSIAQIADRVIVAKVTPDEVDRYVFSRKKYKKLNYLEAITMGKVIDDLDVERVYVDASDINEERFGRNISDVVKKNIEIISVHHADRKYPIVSAASIIAKVTRDAEIEDLRKQYGEIGSGYPSDLRTRKYLQDWLSSYGTIPSFSRKSWKTWRKIIPNNGLYKWIEHKGLVCK